MAIEKEVDIKRKEARDRERRRENKEREVEGDKESVGREIKRSRYREGVIKRERKIKKVSVR